MFTTIIQSINNFNSVDRRPPMLVNMLSFENLISWVCLRLISNCILPDFVAPVYIRFANFICTAWILASICISFLSVCFGGWTKLTRATAKVKFLACFMQLFPCIAVAMLCIEFTLCTRVEGVVLQLAYLLILLVATILSCLAGEKGCRAAVAFLVVCITAPVKYTWKFCMWSSCGYMAVGIGLKGGIDASCSLFKTMWNNLPQVIAIGSVIITLFYSQYTYKVVGSVLTLGGMGSAIYAYFFDQRPLGQYLIAMGKWGGVASAIFRLIANFFYGLYVFFSTTAESLQIGSNCSTTFGRTLHINATSTEEDQFALNALYVFLPFLAFCLALSQCSGDRSKGKGRKEVRELERKLEVLEIEIKRREETRSHEDRGDIRVHVVHDMARNGAFAALPPRILPPLPPPQLPPPDESDSESLSTDPPAEQQVAAAAARGIKRGRSSTGSRKRPRTRT